MKLCMILISHVQMQELHSTLCKMRPVLEEGPAAVGRLRMQQFYTARLGKAGKACCTQLAAHREVYGGGTKASQTKWPGLQLLTPWCLSFPAHFKSSRADSHPLKLLLLLCS